MSSISDGVFVGGDTALYFGAPARRSALARSGPLQEVRNHRVGLTDLWIEADKPTSLLSTESGSTANARYTAQEEDFDEPDLLIGWGGTVDADLLCWYASNPDPDQWTTVIWRRMRLDPWAAEPLGA